MKPIDMTKIYRKYKGKWVAIKSPTDTTVIASGKTLHEALTKAQKRGVKMPMMVDVPKEVLPIVGLEDSSR
ncbi:succinyl-CoA synthetase subunit alpha [Candidatus Curtissbacteria bacterium]|nr:succinyl-CoA synthetase subunit alpha [Candidatus Curtissbacteria bacterium]